jgi:AraC family transcriptional regulator
MSVATQTIAAGAGWRVLDVICTHGPQDRPFEEQRSEISIAVVTAGTFQYRTRQGSAMLVPGALLLGNAGTCFQCGHEHATGDHCLAFHFTPEHFECVAADVPGARALSFTRPSLPPVPQLVPLLAAEAARDDGDADAFEELAVRLIGAVVRLLAPARGSTRQPSAQDERRITAAVRHIEHAADEKLSLSTLARKAGLSRYHFLRSFRQATGLTPHQFLLRTRLNRAAVRLRTSNEPISTIAFDAGFNDLSTFNHRFLRLMGATPGAYRAANA